MLLKSTLSFALLICTIVSAVAGSVADAKSANPLRQCSASVELSPCSNATVSPAYRGGNQCERINLSDSDLVTCRPNYSQQPPAFYPQPQQTAPLPPVVTPQSVISSVTDNGIVGLFGLVVGAIAGAIGGIKGHFKANDDDEVYADYWNSVRQNASSQKPKK